MQPGPAQRLTAKALRKPPGELAAQTHTRRLERAGVHVPISVRAYIVEDDQVAERLDVQGIGERGAGMHGHERRGGPCLHRAHRASTEAESTATKSSAKPHARVPFSLFRRSGLHTSTGNSCQPAPPEPGIVNCRRRTWEARCCRPVRAAFTCQILATVQPRWVRIIRASGGEISRIPARPLSAHRARQDCLLCGVSGDGRCLREETGGWPEVPELDREQGAYEGGQVGGASWTRGSWTGRLRQEFDVGGGP